MPAQYTMPPGEDPRVPPPDPNRALVLMSEPDAVNFIVQDVLETREGVEWRTTGAHPKFRFPRVEPGRLDFYLRCFVAPDHLKIRGEVLLTVSINGHALGRVDVRRPGILEQRLPIPGGFLAAPGPVELAMDVDPLWGEERNAGVLVHSIGFERQAH